MRRIMSLWLPDWPIDRLRRASHAPARPFVTAASPSPLRGEGRGEGDSPRRQSSPSGRLIRGAASSPCLSPVGRGEEGSARPFVTAATTGNRRLVVAADPAAVACGIMPGLPLADAQAYCPGLAVCAADPAGDAAALRRLAEWCGRWSPWTTQDGDDGILLDITGCAHLLGGEARLIAEIVGRLGRQGVTCRAAIADTAGAAWAMARFGQGRTAIITPGEARQALADLPVAALRLPGSSVADLERLGLERVGDLYRMARAALAQRFGDALARRLDHALGAAGEPLSPLHAAPARRSRLTFAEPIATPEDLARALALLIEELCRGLAAEGVGARRLELACYRVDGIVERAAIGTARASRDPRHLTRLFAEKIATLDPGLGIEDMVLTAPLAERLAAAQLSLARLKPSPLGRGQGEGVLPLGRISQPDRVQPSPRPSPGGRGGSKGGGSG